MPPKPLTEEEQRQKAHYDEISAEYELHYADENSKRYLTKFMFQPMTAGINLVGAEVLEAMCGSGSAVPFLLAAGANVTGMDISPEVIASFERKWPKAKGIAGSIFESGFEDNHFDCIVVIGGFHHLHPLIDRAMDELYRILKPGGYLCFMEPHAGSLPDMARRWWYKVDNLFEKNEEAIDLDNMQTKNRSRFDFVKTIYGGNVAYLLVFNSMVFRVPLALKKFYTPPFLFLEGLIGKIQGKKLSCFVLGQWRKKPL